MNPSTVWLKWDLFVANRQGSDDDSFFMNLPQICAEQTTNTFINFVLDFGADFLFPYLALFHKKNIRFVVTVDQLSRLLMLIVSSFYFIHFIFIFDHQNNVFAWWMVVQVILTLVIHILIETIEIWLFFPVYSIESRMSFGTNFS